jgi:protocatechuate 3,4-dioxygenase beta subunit
MGGAGGGQAAGGQGAGGGSEPLVCTPSDDNILGPYYRPDAPFQDDLTDPNMAGVRVTVQGSVSDENCEPIAGALIDLWQADHDGGYDNDGNDDPAPNIFVLRGRLHSGSDGQFSFLTIVPGHYLNGPQYRPAHIHVRVSAPGFTLLTTQLYFKGDPYNDIDPYIKPSLIMDVTDVGSEKQATFDFVLAPE